MLPLRRSKPSMLRSRDPFFAPQIACLRDLELGHALSTRLSWRGELAALSFLKKYEPGLKPSAFNERTILDHFLEAPANPVDPSVLSRWVNPQNLNPFIARLVPSTDSALLAVAGNDARVEIHEPSAEYGDSFRLNLVPEESRLMLSSCQWMSPRGSDRIVISFSNSGDVWEYDLHKCRIGRPTHTHRMFKSSDVTSGVQKSVSDMVRVDRNCLAVALGTGLVKLIDLRAGGRERTFIGNINTGMGRPLLAAEGVNLYAGEAGEIALYDRRATTPESTTSIRSFEAAAKRRGQVAKKKVGPRRPKQQFDFMKVPPGAPPGCLVYHSTDGTVGLIDMADHGSSEITVLEAKASTSTSASADMNAVEEFGALALAMNRRWFISRRQGDITQAPGNRGWRVVVPCVNSPGIRVVAFGPGDEGRSFTFAEDEFYYTCVHLENQSMDHMLLGTNKNTVVRLSLDFDRPRKDEEAP